MTRPDPQPRSGAAAGPCAGPGVRRVASRPGGTARPPRRRCAGRGHVVVWVLLLLALGIAGMLGLVTCSGDDTTGGERAANSGASGNGRDDAAPRPGTDAHTPRDGAGAPDEARRGPGRAQRPSASNAEPADDAADLPVRLLLNVQSARGGPVADAAVVITIPRGSREFRGTSDTAGRAEARLPAGAPSDPAMTIQVHREGFAPYATLSSVPPSGELRLPVYLDPAASVRVRVVRDADGAPVAGATVALAPGRADRAGAAAPADNAVHRAVTGPDGGCLVLGADVRRPSCVRATAPGFAPATAFVRPLDADTVATTEIRLVAAGTIRGRVTDWEDRPVRARVSVFASGASAVGMDDGGEEIAWRAASDETGAFEVSGLALDGVFDLRVEARGDSRQVIVVPGVRSAPEDARRDVVVCVPQPGRLVVRLAPDESLPAAVSGDDENALPAPTIGVTRLDPAPATLDGSAALGNGIEVSPGTYRVVASPTAGWPGGEATAVVASGSEVVVTISAREAFALPGRVLDADGGPIADVEVTARLVGADEDLSVTTDAEGRFLFPRVRRGLWELSAEHKPLVGEPAWADVGAGAARGETPGHGGIGATSERAGTPRVPDVTLRLGPGATFLVRFPPEARGRESSVRFDRRLPSGAEDDDGEVPDGWADKGGVGSHGTGDGTWGPAMPGRWRIVARIAGFRVWRTEVDVAPGELREIRVGPLDPAVTIAGRVVDAAGTPVEDARVSLVDGTWNSLGGATKEDGVFPPLAAPSGPVVVDVVAEGYTLSRVTLDATFGMPPVTFRLFRGGTAEVRVRRADGSPAASIPVVRVTPDGVPFPDWFGLHLATDERGIVRLRAAPGTVRVRLGESDEIEVKIEDERTTVWTATVR